MGGFSNHPGRLFEVYLAQHSQQPNHSMKYMELRAVFETQDCIVYLGIESQSQGNPTIKALAQSNININTKPERIIATYMEKGGLPMLYTTDAKVIKRIKCSWTKKGNTWKWGQD